MLTIQLGGGGGNDSPLVFKFQRGCKGPLEKEVPANIYQQAMGTIQGGGEGIVPNRCGNEVNPPQWRIFCGPQGWTSIRTVVHPFLVPVARGNEVCYFKPNQIGEKEWTNSNYETNE